VFTRIAITGQHPVLAASVAMALRVSGRDVQITDNPDTVTQELVVTAALGNSNDRDVHWLALTQARDFHRSGGKSLILLQDTGGNFNGGPSRGWCGGMAALARTAAREWPEMQIRCVDIAVDAADLAGTAQRLLTALATGLPQVGIDLSGRVYALQPGEALSQSVNGAVTTPTAPSDVWLVSGGARGVTAACIEALALRSPARFALLGRSLPAEWPENIEKTSDIKQLRRQLALKAVAAGERPVPSVIERGARQALAGQEIREALQRLKAAGVVAKYYPCDIASRQQVQAVIALIHKELGQISALVHGAGVLADSLIVDKTKAQFDRVFDTKVMGLQNLLTALADTKLSHAALFSSAAAFYGNTGQADYAMANEVLNRVAQSLKRRCPQATVKSFNWGPWDSGMVDQTLARYFKERGIGLISMQAGAALFADVMLTGDRHGTELLVGDAWADEAVSNSAS